MTTTQPPLKLQYLNTPDNHKIAYAQIGNPALTPILYLHGGPGSNANPGDAKLFNLERHNVVMFDQRGCGKSTPTADIENNTTQHLINDIEQLRQQLGIQQWKVYGGSWGAALALEYAKQHAKQVIAIILRGSFLARKQDLDWFIRPDGIAVQHPKAYQALCEQLSPAQGESLTSCLYRILKQGTTTTPSHDRACRKNQTPSARQERHLAASENHNINPYQAALAWDHWEATVMGLPKSSVEADPAQQQKRIFAKLVYAHYCHHRFFLGNEGVMKHLDKLINIPVTLIHGNKDQVCQLSAAETLDKALPNSRLVIVNAGHSLNDTEIKQALWNIVTHSDIL